MEGGVLKRRLIKIAIWVAGFFALFTIVGFLVLPPVAKSVLVKQLSKALHRDVSIEKIKINPYALSFSIKGLMIKDRGKKETFVSLGEVSTALSPKSIFKRAPIVTRLSIVKPYIRVIRNPDETFNFTDIMVSEGPKKPEPPKPKKEAKPFQFSVNNIVISEGHIEFFDGPKNIQHTIKDLNVAVPFVANMNDLVHVYQQPRFSANINGDLYSIQGKTKPFEESLESFLDITIKDLDIPHYMPYIPVKTNFVLNSGTVDVTAKISFKRAPDKTPSCIVTGDVAIRNIAMDDMEKNPLVRLGSCEIALGTIQPFTPSAHLAKISLKGLELNVKKDKKGQIDLASLVGEEGEKPKRGTAKKTAVEKAVPQKAAPKAEESPLPDIKLDEFLIEQGTVTFRDQSPAEPADIKITDFTMKMGNLSTVKDSTSDLTLSLTLNKTGTVSLKGPVGINPVSANLAVAVKGIGIRPFQPYFTDKVKIAVTSGQVQTTGTLALGMDKNAEPTVKFTGGVLISNFASVDKESGDDLLKWKALSLTSINAGSNPVSARIAGISLADFYAGLAVQPDGTLNLSKIFVEEDGSKEPATAEPSPRKREAAGPPAKEGAKPAGPPAKGGKEKPENISIGAITLQGGTIDFFDKSIKPRYTANLTEIGGRVAGFSLNEDKNADVEVRGKINKSIPLEITGSINPAKDNLFADLKVKFTDLDLSDMSPYSAKYIGYKIQKGKLSMDLKYLIKKRNLDSQNVIFIDQLTLGEKVESKDALKLPFGLAIALLRDRNGRITLDVPVSGSLDDPKFSVWSIVIKVIVNLITKAATAPFALLGALVGGGEELSYIEYDYGSFRLSEANLKKIDSLTKALSDRPQLKIDIEGRVDPDKDRDALKTYLFHKKVKVQKMNVLIKKGETVENVDDVKIEPGEYEQYLTRAYKAETFAKPRNVIGLAKSLPVPEMEKLMLTHTEVTDADLRDLANKRALRAKDAILKSGQITADRVFVLEPKVQASEKKGKVGDNRVDFKLK